MRGVLSLLRRASSNVSRRTWSGVQARAMRPRVTAGMAHLSTALPTRCFATQTLNKADFNVPRLHTQKTKRFFKEVTTQQDEQTGGWSICVDGKAVKTPAGVRLMVPKEETAGLIASEWAAQEDTIKPHLMPMTTIAIITLDQSDRLRQDMINTIVDTIKGDILLVRAPETMEDGVLLQKQVQQWNPVLQWAETEFNLSEPFVPSTGYTFADQPSSSISTLHSYVNTLDNPTLVAVDYIVRATKSGLVALAIEKGHLTPTEALDLVRLEDNHQIEQWGEVSGGHDLDRLDASTKVRAASLFIKTLRSS